MSHGAIFRQGEGTPRSPLQGTPRSPVTLSENSSRVTLPEYTGTGGGRGPFGAFDLHAAEDFLELLHGGAIGRVALLAKTPGGRSPRTFWSRPNRPHRLPSLPRWVEDGPVDLWVSVCCFRGTRRLADLALEAPALWADLDPPRGATGPELEDWRARTWTKLRGFRLAPSLLVDSGRGWHAYWLLREPVLLAGNGRARRGGLVVSLNRALAAELEGDLVADLSRTLRLPGTVNHKPGAGPCVLVERGGPRYALEDLEGELELEPPTKAARGSSRPPEPPPVAPSPPRKRGRGRPALGATKRDLRSLSAWARALVEGGAWRAGRRYQGADGKPDRSRADMAAVGAMVRGDWPDSKIRAAFERPDWKIGWRFRELLEREGERRAADYLKRTIAKARRTSR